MSSTAKSVKNSKSNMTIGIKIAQKLSIVISHSKNYEGQEDHLEIYFAMMTSLFKQFINFTYMSKNSVK